jgi:hypothetical protein
MNSIEKAFREKMVEKKKKEEEEQKRKEKIEKVIQSNLNHRRPNKRQCLLKKFEKN